MNQASHIGDALQSRLFDALLSSQTVAKDALDRAQAAAATTGRRLDHVLAQLGLLSDDELSKVVRRDLVVPDCHDDATYHPTSLPSAYLRVARLLPVTATDGGWVLGMIDPLDDFAAKAVELRLQLPIRRARLTNDQFERLAPPDSIGSGPSASASGGIQTSLEEIDLINDAASDAPTVSFIQRLLVTAVRHGASDIHLRCGPRSVEAMLRIDGRLVPTIAPSLEQFPEVISRLKLLAKLDIAERRLPQDGRIRGSVAGQPVELRLSTMPHVHGEGAVLRVLNRDTAGISLESLGFSEAVRRVIEGLLTSTEGLILVTGPTGSGKTTTLYAALKELISPDLNIVTVEDPIEYRIDGAAQVQIDEKAGLTFPKALRSILRQDPDVLLVGEIRDNETAQIAVQAALTGHLVLATLHTNSALAAIPRLMDMGIEPYLLSAALRGAVAQRLVRRRCACNATADCGACGGTGFIGRVAIGEAIGLTSTLVEAITDPARAEADASAMIAAAGFVSMREDAQERVERGELDRADLAGVIDGIT